MQFRGHEYFSASMERMVQAEKLLRRGEAYAIAMYCGGLAVECLLRAFRWQDDNTFEGRHDLSILLKASGILRVDEDHMRRKGKSEDDIQNASRELRANINEIVILWHNNLRFASEARLNAYLRRMNRVQGVGGDPLKKNATDLINAAQFVVNRGMVLWKSKTRS